MKKRRHDAAPNEEWVLMYRKGLSGYRIAELVGRPENTITYHLRIAKASDPTLQSEHDAARPQIQAGKDILENLVRYVQDHGEFPTSKASDPGIRKIGYWIERRRFEASNGIPNDEFHPRLDEALPGWREPQKRLKEDVNWSRKFESLVSYLAAGNDWPRNRTGESEEERAHGRWLGTQRHLRSKGELDPDRHQRLDDTLPGWVEGRKSHKRS